MLRHPVVGCLLKIAHFWTGDTHPKTKRPKLFRVGTFAEQPSPEVCSLTIMPTVVIERLFKIAQRRNIFIRPKKSSFSNHHFH